MSDVQITTKDPFDTIRRAVDKAVDLVKPTYGPASNKVIISKATHGFVLDDGVQIMRDLELPDPSEHAVLKVIREVAIKTNDRAGDGTTGSMIMLQAIVGEVAKKHRRDGHRIERELRAGLAEAVSALKGSAKEVKTLDELRKVARVSFDNEEVSSLIAETWHKVGRDGVVTVDTGPSMRTTSELTDGVALDHGYISPFMVTNPERMEAVIEKPRILITDYRLTEATDIAPILNKMAEAKLHKLLVIAENVEQHALATLVINEPHVVNPITKRTGIIQSVAVVAPSGDLSKLEDIALLVGARVVSKAKGDKLEDVTVDDLGSAERFVAKQDSAVITGPKGDRKAVQKAVADLSAAAATADTERERKALQKRMAFFTNKIAVIRVGAPTENEQKSLKYKVEDAVNAVKSAYKDGVVCGAGLSLARLETSSPILNTALKAPHQQLMDNMGMEPVELKPGQAVNVVTGQVGKPLEVGVVDPVEVLVAGIESAVSIASLLVTTSGMVVEKPKKIPHERG